MSFNFEFIISRRRLQLEFNNKIYYIPRNIKIKKGKQYKEKFYLLTDINKKDKILNGAFSIIMIYKSKKYDNKIAMKIYIDNNFTEKGYKKVILNELEFYESIDYKNDKDSKHICKYYGKYNDEYGIFNYTYLFLEYLDKDLFDSLFVYKLKLYEDYKSFLNMIYQIYDAIEYIHKKGYIYNDLKMENLMLSKDGVVKIIDFNCIVKIDSERDDRLIGTVNYLSPEALYYEETNNQKYMLSVKTDYWNIGILIYEFVNFCSFPYINKNIDKTKQNIKTNILDNTNYAIDYFCKNTKKYNYLNLNDTEIDNLAILFANCLKTDPTKRRFLKNVIEVEL